jgi:hypothetical protein
LYGFQQGTDMEIIGGGSVIEYGPKEEVPQKIGADPFWQESVVLVWYDAKNQIGGFHRIGHEPNCEAGPQVSLSNNIFSPEWVFKRADVISLREGDRGENTFNCGDDTCIFEYIDHPVWYIKDQEVSAEIHAQDVHTPVDIYPKSGTLGEDIAPNHMEVASTVSGKLTIKGKEFDIDGLAFRDHGWGKRDWDAFLSHRWIAGVFDENLSLLAMTLIGVDDKLINMGCVFRDNQLIYTDEVEIVTYLESDGLSHRGGQVTMKLSTGEVFEIECTPIQKGAVSMVHCVPVVDTLCEMRMDDKIGFCDFETANNTLQGKRKPVVGMNAFVENGMHPAKGSVKTLKRR